MIKLCFRNLWLLLLRASSLLGPVWETWGKGAEPKNTTNNELRVKRRRTTKHSRASAPAAQKTRSRPNQPPQPGAGWGPSHRSDSEVQGSLQKALTEPVLQYQRMRHFRIWSERCLSSGTLKTKTLNLQPPNLHRSTPLLNFQTLHTLTLPIS